MHQSNEKIYGKAVLKSGKFNGQIIDENDLKKFRFETIINAPLFPAIADDSIQKSLNVDELLKNYSFYNNYLDAFLTHNFIKFWSLVYFHGAKIRESLNSYVKCSLELQRYCYLYDNINDIITEIHGKYLLFIQRLLKQHDSVIMCLKPEFHFEILKQNNLINFEILLGVCHLYSYNEELVSYLILKAIKICSYINQETEIQNIIKKIREYNSLLKNHQNILVAEKNKEYYARFQTNLYKLFVLIDSVTKLSSYHRNVVELLHKNRFEYLLVDIYNNTLSEICDNFTVIKENRYLLWNICKNFAITLLSASHEMFLFYIENIVENSSKEVISEEWFDKFLDLLNECFSDSMFISDYNHNFELMQQFEKISVFCPFIDKNKWDHVNHFLAYFDTPVDDSDEISKRDALESKLVNRFNELLINASKDNKNIDEFVKEIIKNNRQSNLLNDTIKESRDQGINGSIQSTVDGYCLESDFQQVHLDSLISHVLDVIPNVGDGFVEKCLEVLNFDAEKVVTAILENNLPKELQFIDRQLIRIPPDLPESARSENNAYLFNVARVTQGKCDLLSNAKEILNDKSEIQNMKEFYRNFKHVPSEIYRSDDDEPLDGPMESEVGQRVCNGFRQLSLNDNNYDNETDSDSDDDSVTDIIAAGPSSKSAFRSFCRDPAELRAIRESKLAMAASRQSKRSVNQNNGVVGKPKGQGQDKNTQKQRNTKNVHKSSRANHNRKAGAAWKQSRGMF